MSLPCYQCNSFLNCNRPERAVLLGCSRFSAMSKGGVSTDLIQRTFNLQLEPDGTSRIYSPIVDVKDEDEDSLVKMVEEVLTNKQGSGLVPHDLKIDDRDMPEFANFYQWSIDPNGSGIKPFSRQLWVGARAFSEICVHCSPDTDWATDILSVPVDAEIHELGERIQFLEYGVCPCCGLSKADLFNDGTLDPIQEIALVVGQRAGKSKSVSFYSGYHVHKFLKLQKPTAVYGTSANEVFTGTFVGLTFSAAVRLLWSPLKELVAYSPWFIQYHAMLDSYGKRFGEELYKNSDLMLQYKHRQLVLNPAGGDKRKLRGETRTIAAQDEIGWWPLGSNQAEDEALEKSGREVYNALDRSLLTVRQAARALWKQGYVNVPTGMFFNVSSPSSKMDMIMHLYRASLHSRKMLGVQLPTWEFNPKFTREYFNDEYMKDPVKAERDYGANPPAGADAYIPASDTVDKSFDLPPQRVQVAYKFKTSNDILKQGAELTQGYTTGKDLPPALMSLDAGLTKNSFAIAIGHRVAGKSTKEIPHFHFPVLIDIIPRNGARLSHSQIFRNVVIPLMKQCNVQAVLADRWNSALLLDEVQEQYGIHSAQYSVKMADFDAVKSYLEGGKFKFPKLETDVHDIMEFDPETYPYCFDELPVDHLYLQIHTVVSTGRSVEKASGMTDDLFRAVVLAGCHLIDDEWCAEHLKVVAQRKAVVLGNVGLLSGGGSGGGGMAGSKIGAVSSRGA